MNNVADVLTYIASFALKGGETEVVIQAPSWGPKLTFDTSHWKEALYFSLVIIETSNSARSAAKITGSIVCFI